MPFGVVFDVFLGETEIYMGAHTGKGFKFPDIMRLISIAVLISNVGMQIKLP